MFPLELVMDFLRVRVWRMVFCALICFSETDLETESAKLSFVSAKFRAMEWGSLFSCGVCESALATAQESF